ncbi:MAG: endonuclease/exonuclease/phosphatase family protein [Proteobacteria bacterium]|nr:endonuclease/exonuclease/phosphatase family protein [Pseudomonadota bacterium]
MIKILVSGGVILAVIFSILLAVAHSIAFFPDIPIQQEPVYCPVKAPELKKGKNLKILNWNVQFMAGTNNTFFFEGGKDTRASREDIDWTNGEVARIINDENPDIILLQEMDEGATRTDGENQLERLLPLISRDYQCYTSTYYWKSDYVPHPQIMGSVGMKLITLSKYKINRGFRHYLDEVPDFFLVQWFSVKRAVLGAQFPIADGGRLNILNTHLSAFTKGTSIMKKQVKQVNNLLQGLEEKGEPWVMGGDFNLLPPGIDRHSLMAESERQLYSGESEISDLLNLYKSAATIKQLRGENQQEHYTHLPNYEGIDNLDRTIDYIFYSDNLEFVNYQVRQEDTQKISDHMPMLMTFTIP